MTPSPELGARSLSFSGSAGPAWFAPVPMLSGPEPAPSVCLSLPWAQAAVPTSGSDKESRPSWPRAPAPQSQIAAGEGWSPSGSPFRAEPPLGVSAAPPRPEAGEGTLARRPWVQRLLCAKVPNHLAIPLAYVLEGGKEEET